MSNFIIKIHRKDTDYSENQLYILNKGINSGKPQKVPFTNSFVLLFQNEHDSETMYWLAYNLWKAKFWHQSLYGSVIPFLRIDDFKKKIEAKRNEMLQNSEHCQKQIQALQLLNQKEAQLHQNIAVISEMRNALLHRYFKK